MISFNFKKKPKTMCKCERFLQQRKKTQDPAKRKELYNLYLKCCCQPTKKTKPKPRAKPKPAKVVKNFQTILAYYRLVYGPQHQPPLEDLNFVWSHLMGDLSDWQKSGLLVDSSSFLWENTPRPAVFVAEPPAVFSSNRFINAPGGILDSLPRLNTLWTPSYFCYPMVAVNRFNPRAWNQYYLDFLAAVPGGSVLQEQLLLEVGNNGGNTPGCDPVSLTTAYFFYLTRGSGTYIKPSLTLLGMNKMHSVYLNQLRSLTPTLAFRALFDLLLPTDLPGAMETALTIETGYFRLPFSSAELRPILWDPLALAYPTPVEYLASPRLFGVMCYTLGMLPFSGPFIAPEGLPEEINASLPNAFASAPGENHIATQAYEYFVQVATNLQVADNILDPFVDEIMLADPAIEAVVNVAQWNAIGGWTSEIVLKPQVVQSCENYTARDPRLKTFQLPLEYSTEIQNGENQWNVLSINDRVRDPRGIFKIPASMAVGALCPL